MLQDPFLACSPALLALLARDGAEQGMQDGKVVGVASPAKALISPARAQQGRQQAGRHKRQAEGAQAGDGDR